MRTKTILNIGDTIQIRSDIREGRNYKMRTSGISNTYLRGEMAPPNTLIRIKKIEINSSGGAIGYIAEDPYGFFTYTDDMFDQETVDYLCSILNVE